MSDTNHPHGDLEKSPDDVMASEHPEKALSTHSRDVERQASHKRSDSVNSDMEQAEPAQDVSQPRDTHGLSVST